MLFTRIEFLILVAALILLLAILRRNRQQKLLLLAASYYFYAYWDWRFLSLIIASTLVDFVVGSQLGRTDNPRKRRWLVATSLIFNLGILGIFKYLDFFIDSLAPLLAPVGISVQTLGLILPIGISFYTFQTLSYTLDVYARKIEPTKSWLDFSLFVGFFPQLVAGPIVRAIDFLPQLAAERRRTPEDLLAGARRFTIGLFKKVFIADNLAVFADEVFANAGAYDCATTWLAVISYSLQIYYDFAGYSDMAIGVARMLGFRIDENFNFPYLARSMSDFWRRWHISLSSWLRDYLYIGLGGNRGSTVRTTRNLMITMLLGGLWHGAAWTFVAWGFVHALALAAQRLLSPLLRSIAAPGTYLSTSISWLATLLVVVNTWVLFRSDSFGTAVSMLRQMYLPSEGLSWTFPFALVALVGTIAVHLLRLTRWQHWLELQADRWSAIVVLITMLWLVLLFHPSHHNPFLYFQF